MPTHTTHEHCRTCGKPSAHTAEKHCQTRRTNIETKQTILDTGQDHEVMEGETLKIKGIDTVQSTGYVRGADYYAREAGR